MPRDNADGSANWISMGLGKTISTLTAVLELKHRMLSHRVLVVGPKKVAKNTWPEEILTWDHTREGLTYSVVIGSEKERLAALQRSADVYLINADNLAWLERVLTHYKLLVVSGDNRRSPFDVIVIDEADLFKNRDSIRFKVMRRFARLANYVIELTGTPATEGYHHLWAQFYLLDGGHRLNSSYTQFLSTYFTNLATTTESPKWVPKNKGAKHAIHERIKDITFTLRAEDYLELPKVNRIVRYVDMDASERAMYERMAKTALIQLADGSVIKAASAAAVQQKLAQLSNGQVYDETRNTHVIHRRKLDELQLIYDEAQGNPLLVAYEFKHDRDLIAREFGAAIYDDNKETENAWNDGEIPMLLIHPRSGGHGVNIQHGGHNLVRYGIAHSLGLYLQLLARLQRPGQKSPFVNEFFIFTRGTIDDIILSECIETKNYTHEGLLNAMKTYVANLHTLDPGVPTF